jgi:long-chain acyl-CoA synthetase
MVGDPTIALDRAWPAMSMAEARATLTAPGARFEMADAVIGGNATRIWKNAPPSLPALIAAARAHGERLFTIHEDERVSYDATFRAVAALAARLGSLGMGKGDRVALAMRNLPEWPVSFFAITSLGAIAVPLNAWWTGRELAHAMADSGAKLLICDDERDERLSGHTDAMPALEHILVSRAAASLGEGASRLEEAIGTPHDWAKLPDRALPAVAIDPDDDATIFYTSGTTGEPKGALGSHRNLLTNIMSAGYAAARSILRRGEVVPEPQPRTSLMVIPLFHVTACSAGMMSTVATGGTLVFMRRWDTVRAMEIIERERVAITGGVPTIAWQLIEHPGRGAYDLSSLEAITYGGAPAAPELVRRIFTDFGALPGNGWGMTETMATVTSHSGEDYLHRPESCGPPVAVADLEIRGGERHHRAADRRRRRTVGARTDGGEGLLGQAGGERGNVRGRVGAYRRHRAAGRRGFLLHRRPGQGRDHPRRREHLFDGGRECAVCPPGGDRRGADRPSSPNARRGACSGGPPGAGQRRDRGGVAGVGAGAACRVQGAGGDPSGRCNAASQRQWQDPEGGTGRAVRRTGRRIGLI